MDSTLLLSHRAHARPWPPAIALVMQLCWVAGEKSGRRLASFATIQIDNVFTFRTDWDEFRVKSCVPSLSGEKKSFIVYRFPGKITKTKQITLLGWACAPGCTASKILQPFSQSL